MTSTHPCPRLSYRGLTVTLALVVLACVVATRARGAPADTDSAHQIEELTREVSDLRALVLQLQASVAQMQSRLAATGAPVGAAASASGTTAPASGAAAPQTTTVTPPAAGSPGLSAFMSAMTINALLDTYYEYNFNDPIGRVNELRAYDVSSNSFSLNQGDLVLESAPDLSSGQRVGVRIDLQFGQATETLQGSTANELRPDLYRNVFQAYGTYEFPVNGEPLELDFGKFASSIGIEGNYTKDQMNYSRSFWFDFLPFYHSGLRTSYKVDDLLTLNYWVVNGAEQTEADNNFKDQLVGFVLSPTQSLSWTFNYYIGQEHPDIVYLSSAPAGQRLPMQQGQPFLPIADSPNGQLRIADTYLSWQATHALTLAAEADYVTERLYQVSPAQRVYGGALYARYQLTPRVDVAIRGEYLADPQGFYSGARQYLNELTLTTEYHVIDGFDMFLEWRRDASSRDYFLTNLLYQYARDQDTLGVGLVWWIGRKSGAW